MIKTTIQTDRSATYTQSVSFLWDPFQFLGSVPMLHLQSQLPLKTNITGCFIDKVRKNRMNYTFLNLSGISIS